MASGHSDASIMLKAMRAARARTNRAACCDDIA
jgi:hypothetical protein